MPKVELDGEELFNLSLSIVGLVLKEGALSISELSQHFDVSAASIKKAVLAISNSEDIHRYETHFYVDYDALEEGEVSFSMGQGRLSEPPLLSSRQASAIAAGLDYLASLPQFADNPELDELRTALGGQASMTLAAGFHHAAELTDLRRAIIEKMQLQLDYLNQLGERNPRIVDPLRLDFVGNRFYLRGWCHKNQDLRTFRVDRIASVQILHTPISEFALKAEIPDEVFDGGIDPHRVKVRCSTAAAEIFWNFPVSSEPVLVDGELEGEIRVGNLSALGRHIARYGGQARVLAPEEAKQAVRTYAQSVLSHQRGES